MKPINQKYRFQMHHQRKVLRIFFFPDFIPLLTERELNFYAGLKAGHLSQDILFSGVWASFLFSQT